MDFDFDFETITPVTQTTLIIGNVGAVMLPASTTANRPGAPTNGMIRYNTDLARIEGYQAGSWGSIGGGGAFVQRFTFQADQMDSPGTANWAVNARAPASADTVNAAIVVRRFDDTTEEGIGGGFTVPTSAVNITLYFTSRAQTAPGGATQVQPTLYNRKISDNAAVGAWSAALNLTPIDIPTNANFQYDTQTISLATLGWSVGDRIQFELTRRGTQAADGLTGDWNLYEMIWEFTT